MLNKRVHVLFDKDLWNNLNKVAKVEKVSAGEFVRRAVKEYLATKKALTYDKGPFKGLFSRKSSKTQQKTA